MISHQIELKQALCDLRTTRTHTAKSLHPSNIFVGVGSDEAIDALLRCFCTPGLDKILTCPPTYGMYAVSAQVNDVEVIHVPLDAEKEFVLRPDLINARLSENERIKLVYLCSPGNPTATLVPKADVQKILENPTWNGIVVIDEAYIDFAPEGSSLAEWVTEWPNLVVMQTLSKAFGMAGIRLGVAFADPAIAQLLNNLKAPYNLSSPTSELARMALTPRHMSVMRGNRAHILQQRKRMTEALSQVPGIGRFRGGFDSNFLLVEILDRPDQQGKPCNEKAFQVYESLAKTKGVVVRFRGKEFGCDGCLRVTVGTEKEVDEFLREVEALLHEIYSGQAKGVNGSFPEEEKEKAASAVVA